jgi:hypothetical protein
MTEPQASAPEGVDSHALTPELPPTIYALLAEITADIAPITKGRMNLQDGYRFRDYEDVLNAVREALVKHHVVALPRVLDDVQVHHQGNNTKVHARIEWTFTGPRGDHATAVVMGAGADLGDKAANKAMTAAHKYALLEVFMLAGKDLADDGDRGAHDPTDSLYMAVMKDWHSLPDLEAHYRTGMDWNVLDEPVWYEGICGPIGTLITRRSARLRMEAEARVVQPQRPAVTSGAQASADGAASAPRHEPGDGDETFDPYDPDNNRPGDSHAVWADEDDPA